MKKRILVSVVALICAVSLLVPPAQAYTPPSNDDGISTYSETFRWYFRTNHGVEEMRLWSITYQRWVTDWVPVNP